MSDPRPPNQGPKRWIARAVQAAIEAQYGTSIPFIEEGMRTHGVVKFMQTFTTKVAVVMEDLDARFGQPDGQLLMAFAALWDGCTFCSRGHLYTSNLFRYRDEGVLFPIRAAEVLELQSLPDAALMELLRDRLADFEVSLALLERQFQLRAELARPDRPDDPLLVASLAAWTWLTDCTIMLPETIEVRPLHTDLARDASTIARYRRARADARPLRPGRTPP